MSSKPKNSKISVTQAKQTERIVTRVRDTLEIFSVDFPNRVEFGLDHAGFDKGVQIYGNCSVSGSALILKESGYINFGS